MAETGRIRNNHQLEKVIGIKKPNTRVYYELQEIGMPNLGGILSEFGKAYNLPMKDKA